MELSRQSDRRKRFQLFINLDIYQEESDALWSDIVLLDQDCTERVSVSHFVLTGQL